MTISLTGSIAMGKSTAAAILGRLGWPIFDADAEVHKVMVAGGAAVPAIAAAFPDVVGPRGVDRQKLGARVFGDTPALRRLEAIVHPMVAAARRRFLMKAAFQGRRAVVIDVPLLFESGGEHAADLIVVVTAPPFLQRQRAMRRPGMDERRLKGIIARQTSDHLKRRQAFLVVPSGLGKRESLRRLASLRKVIRHPAPME